MSALPRLPVEGRLRRMDEELDDMRLVLRALFGTRKDVHRIAEAISEDDDEEEEEEDG
jgi:hypothetical protein